MAKFFEYTTKDGVLTICESINGIYLTHNPSGDCRGVGDGSTWHSIEAYANDIEQNQGDYMEIYFPDEQWPIKPTVSALAEELLPYFDQLSLLDNPQGDCIAKLAEVMRIIGEIKSIIFVAARDSRD